MNLTLSDAGRNEFLYRIPGFFHAGGGDAPSIVRMNAFPNSFYAIFIPYHSLESGVGYQMDVVAKEKVIFFNGADLSFAAVNISVAKHIAIRQDFSFTLHPMRYFSGGGKSCPVFVFCIAIRGDVSDAEGAFVQSWKAL